MCNDYERHVEWEDYCRAMAEAELGMPAAANEAQLPSADDVRVGDVAPVIVASGNTAELVPMTWGFPPARPKGAPVFNFRSEGRRFGDSKRCLIPASAFFEFTGTKTPKSKWRFALPDGPVMAVAGLWREGHSNERSFTMLTTAPGPDVAPFHNRQVAVLRPEDWGRWLHLDSEEASLLKPLEEGQLQVTLVRSGAEPPPRQLLRHVV